jgi:hypothetical protein
VVASEVRKLAERSQTAAGEISKLSSSSVEIAVKAGTKVQKGKIQMHMAHSGGPAKTASMGEKSKRDKGNGKGMAKGHYNKSGFQIDMGKGGPSGDDLEEGFERY